MLVQIQNPEAAHAETPDTWEQDFRLFDTEFGHHLFMVNGSRVYSVPGELIAALSTTPGRKREILASHGLAAAPYIDDEIGRASCRERV